MPDGAHNLLTVPYDEQNADTCPMTAVENWIATVKFVGWNMEKGYLFPTISKVGEDRRPVQGSLLLSESQMTVLLKQSAVATGVQGDFSMRSFRSGEAVSRAFSGVYLSTIMQRAFWKNPKTALRYMLLTQVVSPGSSGYSMTPGVTEDQYKLINEFPLSEQSWSWAAFGNEPNLYYDIIYTRYLVPGLFYGIFQNLRPRERAECGRQTSITTTTNRRWRRIVTLK